MDHVEVDGLQVAYERTGDGPALVLLHGFAGDHREWRAQIEGLSDRFTVVAWDAPGSGGSSDPPESFRMPDYADCLARFLISLRVERPHVAGLSFGGALALELIRRHPSVPRSLVLVGAYAGWAGSLPSEVVEERLWRSIAAADLPPDMFASTLLPTLVPGDAPQEIVEELLGIMTGVHPAGFRTMARSLAEADLRDVLPRIVVPTLLLYGDRDERAPLDVGETLHAEIPGSTLVVLPGVGHVSTVQAGERITAEIRAFLAAGGTTVEPGTG